MSTDTQAARAKVDLGVAPHLDAVMVAVWSLVRSGPNFDGREDYVRQALVALVEQTVAIERERLRVLVQAVRDANAVEAHGDYPFRVLTARQEHAWMALLAGLEGLTKC